jgi:hypothetical protein
VGHARWPREWLRQDRLDSAPCLSVDASRQRGYLSLPIRREPGLAGQGRCRDCLRTPPETVDSIARHFANGPQVPYDSLRQMAQPSVNRSHASVNPLQVNRFTCRVVILDANRRQVPGEIVVFKGNDEAGP